MDLQKQIVEEEEAVNANDEDDDENTYKGHRGRRVKARTMMEVAEQV